MMKATQPMEVAKSWTSCELSRVPQPSSQPESGCELLLVARPPSSLVATLFPLLLAYLSSRRASDDQLHQFPLLAERTVRPTAQMLLHKGRPKEVEVVPPAEQQSSPVSLVRTRRQTQWSAKVLFCTANVCSLPSGG